MVVNNKRYQQTDKYSTKLSEAMQNHLDPFVEVWEQKSYDLDFFALKHKPYLSTQEKREIKNLEWIERQEARGMSDEEIAAHNEYIQQGNPFEEEGYQEYLEAQLKRYEELHAEYLNILRSNDEDKYETFIVKNKSDLNNTPFQFEEESRITEINEIYLFQFKFLTGFKKIFNDIFISRKFWIDHSLFTTAPILLIGIDQIKNTKALIDFCREVSLALKASKVTEKDIQEYHLKNYDILERDCKIFIEQFLRCSDYNKTTIPLLRILVNSGLHSDLKNIFTILKKKLIFSYLLNDTTFHDYQVLDEISNKDYWNDEFVSSLTEEVKKRIQDIDKKQEVFNTLEFEQELGSYLYVKAKSKKRGPYFEGKPFSYKGYTYECENIKEAFEIFKRQSKDEATKVKLAAYADQYKKEIKDYIGEEFPSIQDDSLITSIYNKTGKRTPEVIKLLKNHLIETPD